MGEPQNSLLDCKWNQTQDEISGDWFEDAESDPDWIEKLNATESCVESNCGEERGHVLTDLIDKTKILEIKWKETEKQYQNLQSENDKLKLQLAHEKHRSARFQKKLRYIEENHDIFNRLKQAYLNMKYNESTGRSMVEIRETASQTWEGVMCSNCIQTAEMFSQIQIENVYSFTKNLPTLLTVRQTEVDAIEDTVSKLKEIINKRESSYGLNIERDRKLREKVKSLENQNRILQEICKGKYPQIASQLEPNIASKGCAALKKIVFKQEKRLREMIKYNGSAKCSTSYLNDAEREIVDVIISKYLKRLSKKGVGNLRSKSCDRDSSHKLQPQVPKISSKTNVKRVSGHGDVVSGDSDAFLFMTKESEVKSDAGDLIDFTST